MRKRAKGRNATTARSGDVTRGRRIRLDTIVPADQLRGSSNMRFAGCYANRLGQCSNQESKEHFMTHCVLQEMSTDPRGVFVSGFSWARTGRWVRPETLGTPILCTAHNSALSGLDAFAKQFADAFARIMPPYNGGRASRP